MRTLSRAAALAIAAATLAVVGWQAAAAAATAIEYGLIAALIP